MKPNDTLPPTDDQEANNAAHGIPVTEDHVRMSPKVHEWANGDPIHVFPPNAGRSRDGVGKEYDENNIV